MRILINYLYQYYPFTTASYLEMVLREDKSLGVFRIGENRIPCADLFINVEPAAKLIHYPGRKSCLWEIDNHIHRGTCVDKYQEVDHVFVTQKGYLPLYPKNKTTWLPLACYPKLHKLYEDEKVEYDVGFLGNDTYPRRRGLLDKIGKKYKLLRSTSDPGEAYSRKLSKCKILFNCSMDNDMNMRVFEAISTGRLLLTDKVDGQDDVLKDGEHYVSFKEWKDLDEKIEYYLKNDKERESIAKSGADYVHLEHTYAKRLETILKTLGFYR